MHLFLFVCNASIKMKEPQGRVKNQIGGRRVPF